MPKLFAMSTLEAKPFLINNLYFKTSIKIFVMRTLQ
jgi:hypothetical protein